MRIRLPKFICGTILSIIMLLSWQPAHAQTAHSITISWTEPTTGGTPTSFNVKRGTASGAEATIASPTTMTYVDTTGVGGTKYFYVVTAVNSAGESAPSNEVSGTFLATVALPATPAVTLTIQ